MPTDEVQGFGFEFVLGERGAEVVHILFARVWGFVISRFRVTGVGFRVYSFRVRVQG